MAISDFVGKIKRGLGLGQVSEPTPDPSPPAPPPARDALQLIAENKKTRVKWLSLGLCGLKAVPAEIGELVWLEHLSLSDYHIVRFVSVEAASFWDYTESADQQNSNSGLSDIAALSSLTMLKSLVAENTQVFAWPLYPARLPTPVGRRQIYRHAPRIIGPDAAL